MFTHRSASEVKAHIGPTVKAYLARGTFYLLLLLAVFVIPLALGQRSATNSSIIAEKMSLRVALSATNGVAEAQNSISPVPGATALELWDQYNNAGAAVTLSATFTDSPSFNSDLADDFVVPIGQAWQVRWIDVDGAYFNGSGPANSFNVFFYYDNDGFPGMQVWSRTILGDWHQNGSTFTINLPTCCWPILYPGTYWVEIQANMTAMCCGEWGWTNRTVANVNAAVWQNPSGSFGACQSWSRRGATCGLDPSAPDQVYRLTGNILVFPTPTASPTPTPTATVTVTATPTASPTPCTPSFRVLIAYSDIGGPPTALRNQILAEGVTAAELFDAFSGTPTLAQLEQYDIVVAFSNNAYNDAVAMGNVLADYADAGGIVVALAFDWSGSPLGLEGRWITGGYTPFVSPAPSFSLTSCLGNYDTTHPLMQGIAPGSLCALSRHFPTLSPGAVWVAMYQDHSRLVAYKTNNGHTGIGINAYLGSNPENFSGLFGRVIVNAGRWLISGPCQTPTPTPTASPTASATPTATLPPSPTPTVTPGVTPTPSDCPGGGCTRQRRQLRLPQQLRLAHLVLHPRPQ